MYPVLQGESTGLPDHGASRSSDKLQEFLYEMFELAVRLIGYSTFVPVMELVRAERSLSHYLITTPRSNSREEFLTVP